MAFSLRCPVCRTKFPWNPREGYPDECPNEDCNSRIGIEDNTVICMPFVRSTARSRGIDKVYRDIEASSIQRAEMAAEMAGVPVSDMADLKISDLRSTRHEGDIAAVPVVNDVTRFMEQSKVGGFQGGQAVEYGSAVQVGPHPNAGARMRTALQNHHGQLTGGAGVSDRPTNEVMQPGYRRRG